MPRSKVDCLAMLKRQPIVFDFDPHQQLALDGLRFTCDRLVGGHGDAIRGETPEELRGFLSPGARLLLGSKVVTSAIYKMRLGNDVLVLEAVAASDGLARAIVLVAARSARKLVALARLPAWCARQVHTPRARGKARRRISAASVRPLDLFRFAKFMHAKAKRNSWHFEIMYTWVDLSRSQKKWILCSTMGSFQMLMLPKS